MLHAWRATSFADRLVEMIIPTGRAKRSHIALPETLDRFRRELNFTHRHKIKCPQLTYCSLRFGIEASNRFKCVSKKIEPYRTGHAWCVKIYYAAAHGIFASFADGRLPHKSVILEPQCQSSRIDAVAWRR